MHRREKVTDRANATRVLGLVRNDVKATKLAEKALSDPKPEVRAAAAAALGDMNSRRSIPKLKKALDDKDPVELYIDDEKGGCIRGGVAASFSFSPSLASSSSASGP